MKWGAVQFQIIFTTSVFTLVACCNLLVSRWESCLDVVMGLQWFWGFGSFFFFRCSKMKLEVKAFVV